MRSRRLRLLLLVCASVVSAFAGETDAVIAEALKPSSLEEDLRRLTDEIGGRVPGTPAAEKAVSFAVGAFKAAGADNARAESFQIPVSWSEGPTRVEVTAPVRFGVRAVSLGWSPPFHAKGARIADVGKGSAEEFAKTGNVAGAVVLVHSEVLKTWGDLFHEYLRAPDIIQRAVSGQAAAIAFMSTREHGLLYRHTNALAGKLSALPMLLLGREDASRIARLISAGRQVRADFSMPNQAGGSAATANVVAELRGSERPLEFVVLGGHLDSWELGTGALDNGCNVALTIDALRAIKASGVRLRRSIRFVLFGAEEQGMLGSRAYVQAHRSELDNAVGVLIFDEGVGRVTGFSLGGRKDVAANVESLLAPLARWNANQSTTDAFVGTDNLDFLLEGVPTFVANQEEANYIVNYHASSDTYDKVDIVRLKNHVAIAAHLAVALANAPERPGPRQSRAEVEKLLRDSGLEQQMKLFGLWTEWERGKRGRAR